MALKYAFKNEDINGRLSIWLYVLAKYDFEAFYHSEK